MYFTQNITVQASRSLARRKFFLTLSVLVAFFLALSAPSLQVLLLLLLVALLAALAYPSPSSPPYRAAQYGGASSGAATPVSASNGGTMTPSQSAGNGGTTTSGRMAGKVIPFELLNLVRQMSALERAFNDPSAEDREA